MKVKELRELLERMDPNADIVISNGHEKLWASGPRPSEYDGNPIVVLEEMGNYNEN